MGTLMQLSEVALDLPGGFFADEGGYERPGCLLRLAHYPAVPTGREGVAAVSY